MTDACKAARLHRFFPGSCTLQKARCYGGRRIRAALNTAFPLQIGFRRDGGGWVEIGLKNNNNDKQSNIARSAFPYPVTPSIRAARRDLYRVTDGKHCYGIMSSSPADRVTRSSTSSIEVT